MGYPQGAYNLVEWQTDACQQDSKDIQHYFSSKQLPTLWDVLPAIKEFQAAWEAKLDDDQFTIYHGALNNGLAKLWKYHSQFDKKPVYVLALFLHPYYKLNYI